MYLMKASNSLDEPLPPVLTLPYLRAMRVYPPIPYNVGTANKDTMLPWSGGADGSSSILIERGQKVVYSSWAIHRSIKIFGDDAYDFCPEGWAEMKGEASSYIPSMLDDGLAQDLSSHSFAISIKYGAARPLIEQYALMEASYAAVRIW